MSTPDRQDKLAKFARVGSAVGTVFALYAVGCSSDSNSNNPPLGTGGASGAAGAAAASGSTSTGGASTGGAGTGGTTGSGGSTAAGGARGAAGDAGVGPTFQVTTKTGPVVGKLDGKVRAFYGIPYAAPPTGSNRWRSPQPVTPWTSPRDATAAPKVCPQIAALQTTVDTRSDEDCLIVNVFTPDPPPASPLPVMVWIHGGAFVFGSGGDTFYDGGPLVTEGNVVLVTINYRLGALGFLALPELTAEDASHPTSGNYGFEDQQAALRWVKDNAAAFSGDPGKVTIFGESAGGFSVCSHLVAPASAGLFQRGISESGLCDGLIDAKRDGAYVSSEQFAKSVGCTDPATVVTCMRGKAANDLVTASSTPMLPGGLFFQGTRSAEADAGADADAGSSVPATWGPVIDGVVITANTGTTGVPLLLGTNSDEGTLFTSPGLFGGTPVANDTEYQAAVNRTFGTAAASKILAQYPSSMFPSANDALDGLAVDAFFACPARRFARAASAAGVDAYLYQFAHVPEKPLTMGLGVFHSSELGYVFGTDFPLAPPQDDEKPLGTTMRGYWTRFATTGDPNGGGSPMWPKYTASADQSMKLDLPTPAAQTGYKKDKCDFWDTALD
ncbi:MAG TPA: carboxylesterase family protein [Polyangiaceae bacterium]|nr:carboxylesterase family protein [Polyangiaceae bacterium]